MESANPYGGRPDDYMAYRGAVHTRFEHSLGTLNEAQRLIDAVNRNPSTSEPIRANAQQLIRMSALMHDITQRVRAAAEETFSAPSRYGK